jgi:DNA-damage-inducible protein J
MDRTAEEANRFSVATLTREQFDAEIEKGLANLIGGKVTSAENVADRIHRDYKI